MHTTKIRINRAHWGVIAGLSLLLGSLQLGDTVTDGRIGACIANVFTQTMSGEWWRLFTAQFIHLDWFHLVEDSAAIGVVWWFIARDFRVSAWRMLSTFLIAGSSGQLVGLLTWMIGITEYQSLVGSSDALHGMLYLYIHARYKHAQTSKDRTTWLFVMSLVLISILYSCATGRMIYWKALKSSGYHHLGGILVYVVAVESGWLQIRLRTNDE